MTSNAGLPAPGAVQSPENQQAPEPATMNDRIRYMFENEALRQQIEVFERRKSQDRIWDAMRLVMAAASIFLMMFVVIICAWIIFQSRNFSQETVAIATSAILVDVLGAIISIWRSIIGKEGPGRLAPVTSRPGMPASAQADQGQSSANVPDANETK
ncbi:hypothetical protein I6A60_13615 [Frankia sp. AgB1.9]|uniref:hypothetical protein n=1 Tax=unclassified Frankia TaxID=2632575 RepID=UPI0019338604|nr:MULTISPECIES: hypothetical protein [unclassified Frankia]MBL7487625.1 hypothetical protein [Frankia sp. AgW1.1]MBL7548909.1 hypothetical protein [Frankia sp. AgB1.9]MBL7624877.1 hypothetical protein [Frankia sp. AgB1.8]